MKFFVTRNAQRYGPYSLEELRREVLANFFRPDHFASTDEGRTWRQIHTLPGIGPLDFAVEVQPAENLLLIRYRGHVRASVVAQCAREVEKALSRLTPGFMLLVDFTDLEAMDLDCAPPLEKIMQLCNDHGIQAVVRVIPDPRCDIGLRIMSYFHYGPEVFIATCHTLDEARETLARVSCRVLQPSGGSSPSDSE
ncbi:MAG TPA: hypothetical protein VGL24_10720 [Chthoniobacterales bacterium]|jgi:anti-anti-sigma regulatory factor